MPAASSSMFTTRAPRTVPVSRRRAPHPRFHPRTAFTTIDEHPTGRTRDHSDRPVMSAPYQQSVPEVVADLHSDASRGLSEAEARARFERYGPNQLRPEPPVPAWRKFLAQFRDPLVILLLIATAISAALWMYEREAPLPYEAIAISAVVLLNAVLGFIQEERAESAVAALRQMAAAHAHVIRDDAVCSVPALEVVPGDVLTVEEGDTIPADARVIQSTALQTAEAAL